MPNTSWRRRILVRIIIPVSQIHIIGKTTCCDLLTLDHLQVWHLKVGQWEEAETCRAADCIYLLKLAPQWSILLYLQFLWSITHPPHFYFATRYISTSVSATFPHQYPIHFNFNIRYISTSIYATFLLQYPLHFYFNIICISASILSTFLFKCPQNFYFSVRYISTSISVTFLLQYLLRFYFNIRNISI